jgi:hypothetical protein
MVESSRSGPVLWEGGECPELSRLAVMQKNDSCQQNISILTKPILKFVFS